MRLLAVIISLLTVAAGLVFATPAQASTTVWADEFTTLNNWTALSTYVSGDDTCYKPSANTISGGVLNQTVAYTPKAKCFSVVRNHSGGYVRSKTSWTLPGKTFTFHAQFKLPKDKSNGLWPALWFRPDDGGIGEFDLFEALGREYAVWHTSIHYDYKGTHPVVTKAISFDPAAWHYYSVTFNKDASSATVALDGIKVYTFNASWMKAAFGGSRKFHARISEGVGSVGSWAGTSNTASRATMPRVVSRIGSLYVKTGVSYSTDTAMYVTGYSYWDNDPPGSGDIAFSKCDGSPTKHCTAAGVGTYSDPTTVAVGVVSGNPQFKPGTRFYIPTFRKYFMVEDTCADCGKGYGGSKWVDVWVDGRTSSRSNSDAYMNVITGMHRVIVSPANGYAVVSGVLSHDNNSPKLYGDTLALGPNT